MAWVLLVVVTGGARADEVLQLAQQKRVVAAQVELHLPAGGAPGCTSWYFAGAHIRRVAACHEGHDGLELGGGETLRGGRRVQVTSHVGRASVHKVVDFGRANGDHVKHRTL